MTTTTGRATRWTKSTASETAEESIGFQLALGPAGEVYREAGEEALRQHDVIDRALKRELDRHRTAEGIVMNSSSWVISARNPG